MARILITGSTQGLGLAAAETLISQGHDVVLHARTPDRATAVKAVRARTVVIGDLASETETRSVADQVNAIGRMDAVIHNAGAYATSGRAPTAEGRATLLAVNTFAPYLLTALMERPDRLIYLSSGMHRDGDGRLDDMDWVARNWNAAAAYSESKLYVTAFALAIARRWPNVLSHAVDPGWVPTRMGGAGAPDDLEEGHRTQAWLAVSDDAEVRPSGGYWHHRQRRAPAALATDPDFQDRLLATLSDRTGARLP